MSVCSAVVFLSNLCTCVANSSLSRENNWNGFPQRQPFKYFRTRCFSLSRLVERKPVAGGVRKCWHVHTKFHFMFLPLSRYLAVCCVSRALYQCLLSTGPLAPSFCRHRLFDATYLFSSVCGCQDVRVLPANCSHVCYLAPCRFFPTSSSVCRDISVCGCQSVRVLTTNL